MKDIRIITLDSDKNETDNRQFDTLKEARAWVKYTGLDANFWDRRAESKGWHKRNVATLQLDVDGECLQDWFPEWTTEPVATPDRSIPETIGKAVEILRQSDKGRNALQSIYCLNRDYFPLDSVNREAVRAILEIILTGDFPGTVGEFTRKI